MATSSQSGLLSGLLIFGSQYTTFTGLLLSAYSGFQNLSILDRVPVCVVVASLKAQTFIWQTDLTGVYEIAGIFTIVGRFPGDPSKFFTTDDDFQYVIGRFVTLSTRTFA